MYSSSTRLINGGGIHGHDVADGPVVVRDGIDGPSSYSSYSFSSFGYGITGNVEVHILFCSLSRGHYGAGDRGGRPLALRSMWKPHFGAGGMVGSHSGVDGAEGRVLASSANTCNTVVRSGHWLSPSCEETSRACLSSSSTSSGSSTFTTYRGGSGACERGIGDNKARPIRLVHLPLPPSKFQKKI